MTCAGRPRAPIAIGVCPWTIRVPPKRSSSASTPAASTSRMRSQRTSSSSSTSSAAPASEIAEIAALTPATAVAVVEVGGRVGVEQEPLALARRSRGGRDPFDVLGREPRRSDSAPPFIRHTSRNVVPGNDVSASPKRWAASRKRLVVAEEAADGAVALALEAADEVDRAEAVGAAVDEVADEPEDGVDRRPSAPQRRSGRRRGGATRARLDGRGRHPRRRRVSAIATKRSRRYAARFGSSTTRRSVADELQCLSVRDEPLEHRELGLEPVGVDRRARDQVDLRVRARGRRLAGADELLVELLARRRPDELDRDVGVPGSFPESRIIFSARSTMRTGSPMSRT